MDLGSPMIADFIKLKKIIFRKESSSSKLKNLYMPVFPLQFYANWYFVRPRNGNQC